MGSTESSESRRVSFGMDEEERVRVLQGIRLSENVVNRMKDSSQPAAGQQQAPPPSALGSPGGSANTPQKESKPLRSEASGGQQSSGMKEDLKRFKQEQATVQHELFQEAKREREADVKHSKVSLPQGTGSAEPEKQKSAQLNAEMYKLSSQQFHEAASKAEGTIKPRRVEPVCSSLQAQILRCYRDNLHEALLCSDLVKTYQHCVSAAHKG
ncbi:MICOS complex subunit MIC25 isoform X3 [Oryctolagus cuniculus]|uniref:MICOS complex subunit MIC25 isoform X3 n=1 Tax=Oryctolagus cuniculus TaxID=9986 RepID=UPI0001CE2B7C|nr:MICOS complex subunit MIC25 isoform X3 [Oryctolagus cuniculus]